MHLTWNKMDHTSTLWPSYSWRKESIYPQKDFYGNVRSIFIHGNLHLESTPGIPTKKWSGKHIRRLYHSPIKKQSTSMPPKMGELETITRNIIPDPKKGINPVLYVWSSRISKTILPVFVWDRAMEMARKAHEATFLEWRKCTEKEKKIEKKTRLYAPPSGSEGRALTHLRPDSGVGGGAWWLPAMPTSTSRWHCVLHATALSILFPGRPLVSLGRQARLVWGLWV